MIGASVQGHAQLRMMQALCFQRSQGLGICQGIAAVGHSYIIAAVLAFVFDNGTQPPISRVVKECDFDHRDDQVDQIVMSLDVSEFMRQDGFYLVGS